MSSVAAALSPAGTSQVRDERVLRVRAATFPRRLAAAIVDLTIVSLVTTIITLTAAALLGAPLPKAKELGPDLLLAGVLDRNPMVVGALGLLLGVGSLYQIYFGGVTGQTVGKRLVGLRVISVRGRAPGPLRGLLRLLALILAMAPSGLGWLWCLFDRERRGLHDHLAGTYVVFDA